MHSIIRLMVAFLVFAAGCGVHGKAKKEAVSNEQMALGWLQRSDFMTPTYERFQQIYDTTSIDGNFVEMIRLLQADVDVVVVLGTWCSDSKREVPRFLKIIDLTDFPASHLKFYGVDRTKKSPDGVTDQFRIELVPTFIFLKNGAEIGRIVENPLTSVEADMLDILAGAQDR